MFINAADRVPVRGASLRRGYSTGACAAIAAKAAARTVLTGRVGAGERISVSGGVILELPVKMERISGNSCLCSVVKDAGDDPDITNGVTIIAETRLIDSGFELDGGRGVGRVTKPGLLVSVGEAAVNPGPAEYIKRSVLEVAEECGYTGGFKVIISVPDGEKIATKTFNPRLGIIGGISILGTTGIVEPMSESALVDSIKLEMDAVLAENPENLLICPGNYGKVFIAETMGIDMEQGVKCSNFIGEALDYAIYKKARNILLVGHAGKLCKLAAGVMNTHSRVADCRNEVFAAHAAMAGASSAVVKEIMNAVATGAAQAVLEKEGLAETVWRSLTDKISEKLSFRLSGKARTEAIVYTLNPSKLYMTRGAETLARIFIKKDKF